MTVNSGTASQFATITTTGNHASAIFAQSIGGGGGKGGAAAGAESGGKVGLTLTLGGTGGEGGDGGAVSVSTFGTISTAGTDSIAILAQSVGGGGGQRRQHQ